MEFNVAYVISMFISCVVSVIAYFISRTIRTIDRNQECIFQELKGISRRVSTLEGEHKVYTSHHFHENNKQN